jgi:hypothetical protein
MLCPSPSCQISPPPAAGQKPHSPPSPPMPGFWERSRVLEALLPHSPKHTWQDLLPWSPEPSPPCCLSEAPREQHRRSLAPVGHPASSPAAYPIPTQHLQQPPPPLLPRDLSYTGQEAAESASPPPSKRSCSPPPTKTMWVARRGLGPAPPSPCWFFR